jgi:hypothetical protein
VTHQEPMQMEKYNNIQRALKNNLQPSSTKYISRRTTTPMLDMKTSPSKYSFSTSLTNMVTSFQLTYDAPMQNGLTKNRTPTNPSKPSTATSKKSKSMHRQETEPSPITKSDAAYTIICKTEYTLTTVMSGLIDHRSKKPGSIS